MSKASQQMVIRLADYQNMATIMEERIALILRIRRFHQGIFEDQESSEALQECLEFLSSAVEGVEESGCLPIDYYNFEYAREAMGIGALEESVKQRVAEELQQYQIILGDDMDYPVDTNLAVIFQRIRLFFASLRENAVIAAADENQEMPITLS